MYRKIVLIVIAMGALWGFEKPNIDISLIDFPMPIKERHALNSQRHGEVLPLDVIVSYIDSSTSQYTFWTQIPDPVHYSENGDSVILIWRGYETTGTGLIAVAFTTNEGNSWGVLRRLNESLGVHEGGGTYPSVTMQNGEIFSGFPELTIPIDWGYVTNISGPFTTDTSQWCGAISEDLDAHKTIPLPLPDGVHVLNLVSSTTMGFLSVEYNISTCQIDSPMVVDPGFSLFGGDYFGNTIMAFGYNSEGNLAAYSYDANLDQWVDQIQLHPPGIDTLSNGEILNTPYWADGIILNDGTPLMVVDIGDGTGIDTVLASRSVWILRPDTAVRIWIAPNPDPINHVIYSQLSIDRQTGLVYAFWEKLDEWHGDTTGYGTWDIWYSYSTDNGYTWSSPINITNTTGVDEAMFQVAKRVANGRAWLAFLRPMYGRVIDLYSQIWSNWGIPPSPVYVYLGYVDVVSISESSGSEYPNFDASIDGNLLRVIVNRPQVVKITIYDVTGREVLNERYHFTQGINVLPLSKYLRNGVYFLNLRSGLRTRTLKFVNLR